jgi:DNA modification methylase
MPLVGQVYGTERATLIQGDCLEVMHSLSDGSVNAVITDPPYGISYQSAWRTDKKQYHPRITNDGQPFIWWLYDSFRVLKDGGALFCFCHWRTQEAFRLAIGWAGFKVCQHVIWDRDWHGMGDLQTSFAPQHDVIWQASKGRCEIRGIRPRSVLRLHRLNGSTLLHPTQKPVSLMTPLIESITDLGHTVLDPFMGSGSTGVACLKTGRRFIGIEIDSSYCNIAKERLARAELAYVKQKES